MGNVSRRAFTKLNVFVDYYIITCQTSAHTQAAVTWLCKQPELKILCCGRADALEIL